MSICPSTPPIRRLSPHDISPNWLDAFQRRQDVRMVYRAGADGRQSVAEPFIDDWSPTERRELALELARIAAAGVVLALEIDGHLAGFAAIDPQVLGPDGGYRQLKELQVDRHWRGRGLGRALLAACAAAGRELGADALYISSHSAVETVAFYEACGCAPARWLHAPQLALEPFDCQLELVLTAQAVDFI
ncbi:GNAT family N-acetyltransferase [Chromobacterium haemolyticum]|uniref:GNAT family N-acetyltransferase n=1 Tax=Chromobacterium haemolyticum TaxID=394935 RepID=UPI00307FBE6C